MTGAILLIIGALITSLLCLRVAWKWRGRLIPVSWLVFLMMALGSFSIAAFYLAIAVVTYRGDSIVPMVPASRALWWFIIIGTALMAIGALVTKCNKND
jgi:hypothetical protein